MARILILIILVWLLLLIIKRVAESAHAKSTPSSPAQKPEQKIVQCAYCGCHVPASETKVVHHQIICNNPDCNKITHGD